ncbi:hypothetical protein [Paenibacillus alginolyticus]|nr:hypothetical protein [Paenibacillus alginolyticus]
MKVEFIEITPNTKTLLGVTKISYVEALFFDILKNPKNFIQTHV